MKAANSAGFTLTEVLVAMVVLAIGILGLTAMSGFLSESNRHQRDLTTATNICGNKMEELKDAGYGNLGMATDSNPAGNAPHWGLSNAAIYTEMVNRDGQPASNGRFFRKFVVCKGSDYLSDTSAFDTTFNPYPGATATPGADLKCTTMDDNRSEDVACLPTDIQTAGPTSKEKKIKLLCAWRDRRGLCHGIDLGSTVVDFGGN